MPTHAPLPTVTTNVSAQTATNHHQTSHHSTIHPATSIEAKLVILGSQGVGKTSLVNRFVNPTAPLSVQSTIGASFVTKKIHDPDSNTTVRLQIWDTAGQERFRSISRLYYRGANAGILCYDVTDEKSWEEMKGWLKEMRENCDFSFNEDKPGTGMVVHVVGTKTDLVAEDPGRREVPFERTIAYIAEQVTGVHLNSQDSTPPMTMKAVGNIQSPDSKRSSGFWTQDFGWDSCHEVSAHDNDGIEEVFRVIARKLIDQRNKREAYEQAQTPWTTDGGDYFTQGSQYSQVGSGGSFRVGYGDKRRSWLGLPSVGLGNNNDNNADNSSNGLGGAVQGRFTTDPEEAKRRGRCC